MKLAFETDEGFGTRATFGVIVLETDETLEPEFARIMTRSGIALYHTRIPMVPEINPETLARMEADLPTAARQFPSDLRFDAVGYGCTSASTVIGSEQVAKAVNTSLPQARVSDPLAALIAAGKSLGVKRLGFVTPYVPEVSARMREKLEGAGFEISSFGSFEEGDDRVVARIAEQSIASAARQVASDGDCEAIVIACTNLRCLKIIPEVEAKLDIPVLSSNQALAWHMMRLAGVEDYLPELGRLFETGLACS